MPKYKAGQEIDAFCTRCKMDLTHRIVAVAAGKPVKVECRTCYGVHQFRGPKGVDSPGAPARVLTVASSPSTRRERVVATKAPPPTMPPTGVHIHLYKIADRFAADTWIQHKSFGVGRVVREVGQDKIEVDFAGDVKVLVHGRTN